MRTSDIDLVSINPEDFEFLCRDILLEKGLSIDRQPSRGADRGVDLIATLSIRDDLGFKTDVRVAVECKHFARSGKSVKENDVGNVVERTLSHNCERYLLITSTVLSTSLAHQLEGITKNPSIPINAAAWTRLDLLESISNSEKLYKKYFAGKPRLRKVSYKKKIPERKIIAIHLHPDFQDEIIDLMSLWKDAQSKLDFGGVRPPRNIEASLLGKDPLEVIQAFRLSHQLKREAGFQQEDGLIQFCEGRLYDDDHYQLFSITRGTDTDGRLESSTISLDMTRRLAKTDGSNFQKAPLFSMIVQQILYTLSFGEGLESHKITRWCVMDYCNHMPDILLGLKHGPKYCPGCENYLLQNGGKHLLALASSAQAFLSRKGDQRVARRMELREKFVAPATAAEYDVALSFAGENRKEAEQLAVELRKEDIKVFYDNFEKDRLWGEDLYAYLSDLYRHRAHFCIMFISQYYARKLWTNHERKSAQARAFSENRPYILPIRMDDAEVAGILPTVGFLRWDEEGPSTIAELVLKKLRSGR